MKIVETTKLPFRSVPAPYSRSQQVVMDKSDGGQGDFTFMISTLLPFEGKTDYHTHEGDELIYVETGYGYSLCEGEKTPIGPGTALYAVAGEQHQVVNESHETMKLVCVFLPALAADVVKNFPRG
jgi:quercetin dioxygenase-like cupin family protein